MVAKTKQIGKSDAIKNLEQLAFEQQIKLHPNFPYPIKPKYSDANTNALTKCVIDYITLKGFHAERINSTGAVKDKRTTSTDVLGNIRTIGSIQWIKSTTQSGTADVSATIQGRSVKVEIKCKATGDNKQRDAQKDYQKQIENAGGFYLIVTKFEDFYNWFNHKKLNK